MLVEVTSTKPTLDREVEKYIKEKLLACSVFEFSFDEVDDRIERQVDIVILTRCGRGGLVRYRGL